MSVLGTIVSDLAKAGNAVKNWVEKAAGDAPAIVQTVTADASKVEAVVEAFFPQSTAAINLGMSILDKVAQAVEDAGSAAGANALNVTLDTQTVNDVKSVIAAAKAGVAKTEPPPAPIPAAS